MAFIFRSWRQSRNFKSPHENDFVDRFYLAKSFSWGDLKFLDWRHERKINAIELSKNKLIGHLSRGRCLTNLVSLSSHSSQAAHWQDQIWQSLQSNFSLCS